MNNVHLTFDPKHQDYISQNWSNFNYKSFGPELKSIMAKKNMYVQNEKNFIECPICKTKAYNTISDRYLNHKLYTCKNCSTEFSTSRTEKTFKPAVISIPADEKPNDTAIRLLNHVKYEPYVNLMQSLTGKGDYLDYSCGIGHLVYYAKNLGFNAFGIENDQSLVDLGKKTFELGDNISTIFDQTKMPAAYDIISTFDTLEHIENPVEYAKTIYQMLKPGGYWLFVTPNRDRLQNKAGIKNTGKHNEFSNGEYPTEYLQRFRKDSHKFLVEKSGLELVNLQSCRILANVAKDISGLIPRFDTPDPDNIDRKIPIPEIGLQGFFESYYQPVLDGLEGYGNYITCVAQKPFE